MQILGDSGKRLIWDLKWPEACLVEGKEISPRQIYPVIRKQPARPQALEVVPMRWGLIPHWCLTHEDLEKYTNTFQARAETAHEKPTFQDSFRRRRCLIQIAGFLEWRKIEKFREKHLVVSSTSGPLILAGLWDQACIDGTPVESFTVLTCPPNALLDDIHQRMPVILGQKAARDWLDGRGDAAEILRPCPSHWLEIVPATAKTPSYDLGED